MEFFTMQILTINMHWLFNLFKDAHGNYKKVVSFHGERSRWRKSIDKKLISWQGKVGRGRPEGRHCGRKDTGRR